MLQLVERENPGLKVLLTGPGSVLGSHLANHLSDSGFSVRALMDTAGEDRSVEDPRIDCVPGGVLDPESILAALDGIQAVFHCDLVSDYRSRSAASVRSHNVEGTRNLLVAMARAGVEDLVHVGSAFSFGGGTVEDPGSEETPYGGRRFGLPCMDSIHSAQELVLRYNESGKLRCVVVNPSLVIGAGAEPYGPLHVINRYLAAGYRSYPSGGTNVVSASDASKATLSSLGRGRAGRCYILGGENLTYRDLLEKFAKSLGVDAPSNRASDAGFLARGIAVSLRTRVRGGLPALTMGLTRLAVAPMYYSSERAVRELEYSPAPVGEAIDEFCRSLSAE